MPNPARPLLVSFAMPEEARPFQKFLPALDRVEMIVTGMGRHHTERALRAALAKNRPAAVFTCGFAGGLDPSLQLGDLVFETAENSLAAHLRAVGARPGRFHCASRMAVTTEEKQALRLETGADAVEMESRWVHEICAQQGVACATLRVISDTASETMPLDFNALTTADLKLNYVKLALALARAPGKLPALLRLQRQTQAAARTLAAFLQRCLAV